MGDAHAIIVVQGNSDLMSNIKQTTASCTVLESRPIKEALEIINNEKSRTAIIVDEIGRLKGTVTDGDIRRALLKGVTLAESLALVMNKDPVVGVEESSMEEISLLIAKNKLNCLPIVDRENKLSEIYVQAKDEGIRTNPVIIMAGGKGKRLRPLTSNCPKPMILVKDKPMLEIVIENFKNSGFGEYILCVNYLREQIEDYFEDGSKFGVNIRYVYEEEPLGTAGALGLLKNENINDTCIVTNADILTRLDAKQLIKYHESTAAAATMCVRKHSVSIPFGVVESEGCYLKEIVEKPEMPYLANAGVYVIEPRIIEYIDKNCYLDMPDLLQLLVEKKEDVAVCPIHEYWLDIGRHETLQEAVVSWDSESKD